MGNYSRDTFDRLKHYVNVRLQQGVPIVDADWNELQDIRKHELETFLRWFVGNGVPLGNDGFAIGTVADANDFSIAAGHCLVEGWTVVNENAVRYQEQTEVPPLGTPSSDDRTDIVYLDVWEREVNAEHDPEIVNPGIGIEACVRTKREWVVRVAEDATELPAPPSGHVFYPLARLDRKADQDVIDVVTDLRHTGLTLAGKVDRAGDRIAGGLAVDKELSFGAQVRQMINLWRTRYGIGVQASTQYFRSDGNFAWYQGGTHNDYAFNPGGGSVQMVIDATGRVGIGTTNPGAKLHVAGDLKITGSSFSIGRNNVGHEIIATDATGNLNLKPAIDGKAVFVRDGNTDKGIRLYGGGSNTVQSVGLDGVAPSSLILQPDGGSVGIGTTQPGAKLEITGDNPHKKIRFDPDGSGISLRQPWSSYSSLRLWAGGNYTRYGWLFRANRDGCGSSLTIGKDDEASGTYSKDFTITAAGNVGIGTASPAHKLHVEGGIWARNSGLRGGDYAEYFKSLSGTEISAATSVVLEAGKVRSARKDEVPIGVISANPGVVGGVHIEWPKKYLRDAIGNQIMEEYEEEVMVPKKEKTTREHQKVQKKTIEEEVTRTEIVLENGKYFQKEITETVTREVEEPVFEEFDLYAATGEAVIGKHRVPVMETYEEEIDVLDDAGQPVLEGTGKLETKERPKLNPDYSESKEYVPRAERPEWNCVGLLGKLPLRKGQPVAESWIKMKDLSDEVELWLVK